MATHADIGVSQPAASTITMKVATVTIDRNSTVQHQEIMVLGDAESSLGIARVMGTAPVSTSVGLVVKPFLAPVSVHHRMSTGTGDATSIKGSAGILRSLHGFNASSAACYVKFHNTAAAPTLGSGVLLSLGIQAGTARDVVLPHGGMSFGTGIGMTIISGITDASTVGVSSGTVIVDVGYD